MFIKFKTVGQQGRGIAWLDADYVRIWNGGEIRDPETSRKMAVVNIVGDGFGVQVDEPFEEVTKRILEARGEKYTAPAEPASPALIKPN